MNNTSTAVSVETEETFFVQNVTPGHHYVTDMGLHFEPYEVKDLLTEDPAILKKSRDIRKSLALGTLVKITSEEADELLEMEIALLQAEQRKEAAQRQTSTVNIEGRQVVADTFDAARGGGAQDKSGLVSTAGFANDHTSYAQAFQNMRAAYANQGRTLTARDFGKMVQENPDLVRNTMNSTNSGTWSGDPNRGRATYAMPSVDGESRTPAQTNMTNFNRDQRLAGSSYAGMVSQADLIPDPELPYAEEIDVLEEDGDAYEAEEQQSKKGAVRRRK